MASTLVPVPAAEPLSAWIGGKRLLAKRIIARVEAVEHGCYAEPFVGMGGVFLRRGKRPKSEVVNDINGDIVNLFRIVQEHPDELARQFNWTLAARTTFRRLVDTPPATLTDIQRAARFAYLQILSFGGRPAETRGAFKTSAPYDGARLRSDRVKRLIAAAHERLQRVHIECMDWADFIARFDKPFTLFYVDPPYWGHETDYGKGLFAREDFRRMAEVLGAIKGWFILSLNDRPEVRECFRAFDLEEVTTSYTSNAKAARRAGELLISN